MRRIVKQLLLLLLFAILSSNSYSQPILNDSTKAYDYWAKRGIIEMVYANMKDYLATSDTLRFKNENQAAKDFRTKFILNIETKSDSELNINFQSIVPFLNKNYWSATASKLCVPLILNYNEKKQLDDQFFSINTSNNNKNWNVKKNEILKNYHSSLESFAYSQNDTIFESTSTNTTNDEISSYNNLTKYIVNLLFLIVGLIIGSFSVIYYSKKRIYSILSTDKVKYINALRNSEKVHALKYIGIFEILYRSKERKDKEIQKLTSEISKLKNDTSKKNSEYEPNIPQKRSEINSKIAEDFQNNELTTHGENVPNNVIEWKVDQEMKSTNILYFTIPEADGSFKNVNGKIIKEIDCFYNIEIDKNNQKGKLFFISSEFDSRALDNIDYYLNPVCEIENISDRTHAKKINVVNFGTVVLIGDTWKIESNKKLKIRLL